MTPFQHLADKDTEHNILSLMMCRPDEIIPKARAELTEDDFYSVQNQKVFSGLLAMFKEKEPIDCTTIPPFFAKLGILKDVGGIIGINYLYEKTLGVGVFETYLQTIKDRARRKHAIQIMDMAIAEAGDITSEFDLHGYLSKLAKIMQERYVRERKLKDVVTDFIGEIERRSEEDMSNVRMMTGIPALDRILHGFAKQELIYIAARPGMGKSAFAIHVVLNAVMEQGFRILYISLEMGERQIFGRMMANLSEVDSSKILHDNNFSKTKEYEVVKNYALALSEQPLFIRTMGVNTPAGIYSQAQQIQAKHGLDAIIIDHVHLMSSGIKGDEANQNANMSHISNELKRMAIEFDIPVIALAQLSRAVEQRKDRHPELSDMRDSGTLEQDADKVIMMYREQYYTREILPVDTVDISVKKHRDGQTGSVSMIFEKQYSRFKPVDFGGTTEPKNYKVPV